MLEGRKQNMKSSWLRKGIIIPIIIVLVGANVVSALSRNVSIDFDSLNRENTLYVGGSGPGNYTKIQDAIDASSDGDMVFVFDDLSPYYEKVEVNKEIDLVGENKNTTIIDGGGIGDVINISAHLVTISGFTIRNSGDFFTQFDYNFWENDACIQLVNRSCCRITNNIIQQYSIGIFIYSADDIFISDNLLLYDTHGIEARKTNCIVFLKNTIIGNAESIYLKECTNVNLTENTVIGCSYRSIVLFRIEKCDVFGNKIIGPNSDYGLEISLSKQFIISRNLLQGGITGVEVSSSTNIIFSWNTISNTSTGIELSTYPEEGLLSFTVEIYRNNIMSNFVGIHIFNSYRIYVQENNFIMNNQSGFFTLNMGHLMRNSVVKVFFEGLIQDLLDQNRWKNNYWDGDTNVRRKCIIGELCYWVGSGHSQRKYCLPWMNFDWHPAQEPYDIPEIR